MKSILFLSNYPAPYRVEFFNQLGKTTDLTVIFTSRPEEQLHRERKWFSYDYSSFRPIFLQKKRSVFGKEVFTDVLQYLNKEYDIIIIGGYSSPTQMIAIEYLRIRKKPFYIEADGGLIKKDSKISYAIKKHFISAASGYFSSGTTTDRYFAYYTDNHRKPIVRFPFSSLTKNEIEENYNKSKQCEKKVYRHELGITEKRVILSVGQMIHRKGFDILIEAMKGIPNSIGVYIVGGQPSDDLLAKVNSNRLTNIHFVGFQDKKELARYYLAADIFVFPTREDVWGLVINEALSYGLPVISSDRCGAALELVKDRNTGYIFHNESVEELHSILQHCLKGESIDLRDNCFEVSSEYTIEKMVEAHLSAISNIS